MSEEDKKSSSSMPSMDEVTSIAKKLYKDVKASVGEIVVDYKDKRKTDKTDKTEVLDPEKKTEPP